MNKKVFELYLAIDFGDVHIAKCIYKSIKPDLKAEGLTGVDVNIELDGSTVKIDVSSNYYGRFRGVYSNILRLINILSQLSC